jgi:hypothetical protein
VGVRPYDWNALLKGATSPVPHRGDGPSIAPSAEPRDITAELTALIAKGGRVVLPEGEFLVSGSLGTVLPGGRLSLSGAGMGKTVLRLTSDLPGALLTVKGNDQWLYNWLSISDLTFDGGGRVADALRLEKLMLGNFTNVEFRDFQGAAIHGIHFWDSDFRNCRFVRCGAAGSRPAIVLDIANRSDGQSNTNNINFIGCTFERNRFLAMDLRHQSAKIKVLGSEFIGHAAGNPPQIRMSHAVNNLVLGNRFHSLGANSIVQERAIGTLLGGNQFHLPPPPPSVQTPPPPSVQTPPALPVQTPPAPPVPTPPALPVQTPPPPPVQTPPALPVQTPPISKPPTPVPPPSPPSPPSTDVSIPTEPFVAPPVAPLDPPPVLFELPEVPIVELPPLSEPAESWDGDTNDDEPAPRANIRFFRRWPEDDLPPVVTAALPSHPGRGHRSSPPSASLPLRPGLLRDDSPADDPPTERMRFFGSESPGGDLNAVDRLFESLGLDE